ncbi:MAG: hypothetical protein L0Y44_04645 [Phycisphaerales bacterium]|nr:hypothetical protein [Phycisphaerales bacterium]MCI0629925.1 hypothetical protein [Phycisphaerales bacterium]
MSKSIAIIIGLVLLVALVLFSMTYTVSFHEVAIKTRFGKTTADSIVTEPGLKFRLPLFADRVTVYDTRLQVRETPLETIQTTDGQQVVARAFMLWKVNTNGQEPLKFHGSFPTIDAANDWLVDHFRTALQSGMSRYSFDDLIGPQSRLGDAEAAIKAEIVASSGKYGIEPVTVGISQLMLPAKTTARVLGRMEATRRKISEGETQRGSTQATGIRSIASTDADKIRQFVDQRAAEIRETGNEEAAKYLGLMNEEKSLAMFLAWLDTLESTLSENSTFVIPTAVAPFHMLQLTTPTDGQGIPLPTAKDGMIESAPSPVAKEESDKPPQSAQSSSATRQPTEGP